MLGLVVLVPVLLLLVVGIVGADGSAGVVAVVVIRLLCPTLRKACVREFLLSVVSVLLQVWCVLLV